MKWIKFKTTKGNSLTVKEDDIALILIDLSTGEGTLRLVNSCFTYDIIDNGVTEFLCVMSVARPLPVTCPCPDRDKCDSCGRTQEVQDLKLENDRLTRRNKLMEDYIHAVACITSTKSNYRGLCDYVSCPYYNAEKEYLCRGACRLNSRELIEQEAAYIIDQLEDI